MDKESEHTICEHARNGGTVLMTAYSAKVDETNKVFTPNMPGRLDDVFGFRVAGFDHAYTNVAETNAGGVEKARLSVRRKNVGISHNEKDLYDNVDNYEYLEPG